MTMYKLVLAIACASACTTADTVETSAPEPIAPPAPAETGKPVLVRQLTVPTGSTNVDAAAGVRYELDGVERANAQAVVAAIRATAAFHTGERAIPATVTLDKQPRDRHDPVKGVSPVQAPTTITIAPAAPLDADTWYTLRFAPSAAYAVRALDSMTDTTDVAVFTGSAPTVRYVFSTVGKASTSVIVFMSEPVALASLAGDAITFWSPAGKLAGCVYREDRCVDASSTTVMSAFEYRFDAAPADGLDATAVRLSMSGQIRGRARTVSAAANVLDRTTTTDHVAYALERADWFPCHGDAATACWSPRR